MSPSSIETSRQWDLTNSVIGAVDRVLLYGPPGTGKTTLATLFKRKGVSAARQEVFSITLTEEMPAAELRGHFIPKAGEFIWMDGPGISAMRNGSRLVLNEIDHASADCMTLLLALLDDRSISRVTLPTGETVTPHKNYHVVATMNGDPGDLPPALRDRFLCINITEANPKAIESLPKDLQVPAQRSVGIADVERRVSLRSWNQYAELREVIDPKDAAQVVFGVRAREVLDAVRVANAV